MQALRVLAPGQDPIITQNGHLFDDPLEHGQVMVGAFRQCPDREVSVLGAFQTHGIHSPVARRKAVISAGIMRLLTILELAAARPRGALSEDAPATGAVDGLAGQDQVVLNAAQQQNVAGQLQPRDMGSDRQAYVSGEMIWLGMSNYAKRSGKGEIVTSR